MSKFINWNKFVQIARKMTGEIRFEVGNPADFYSPDMQVFDISDEESYKVYVFTSNSEDVIVVTPSPVVFPSMSANLFYGFAAVRINLINTDLSQVSSLQGTFKSCSNLRSFTTKGLNLINVITLQGTWANCPNLASLDLQGITSSRINNVNGLVENCKSLRFLDVSVLYLENVMDFTNMCFNCHSLETLILSNIKARKAISFNGFCRNCVALVSVETTGFEVPSCRAFICMFDTCRNLAQLDLSGVVISANVPKEFMFRNCLKLVYLSVPHLHFAQGNPLTCHANGMFESCNLIEVIDAPQESLNYIYSNRLLKVDNYQSQMQNQANTGSNKKYSRPVKVALALLPPPISRFIEKLIKPKDKPKPLNPYEVMDFNQLQDKRPAVQNRQNRQPVKPIAQQHPANNTQRKQLSTKSAQQVKPMQSRQQLQSQNMHKTTQQPAPGVPTPVKVTARKPVPVVKQANVARQLRVDDQQAVSLKGSLPTSPQVVHGTSQSEIKQTNSSNASLDTKSGNNRVISNQAFTDGIHANACVPKQELNLHTQDTNKHQQSAKSFWDTEPEVQTSKDTQKQTTSGNLEEKFIGEDRNKSNKTSLFG